MANIFKTIDACNYVEIALFKKKHNDNEFDISFTQLECHAMIQNVHTHNKSIKFFKKHEVKKLYKNLVYSISDDKIGTVYSSNLITHHMVSDRCICNYFSKQNLPSHSFPSSTDIFDIIDCKRLTAKISGNLYLNFESIEYRDGGVHNHVYFNINKYADIDVTTLSEALQTYIKIIELESIY